MIEYRHGNIFTSGAQLLVNPVNCVGQAGKGLAKEFKKIYPKSDEAYRTLCESYEVFTGEVWMVKAGPPDWSGVPFAIPNPADFVCLFPTKKHWNDPSKIGWIEKGLKSFAQIWEGGPEFYKSVAFPALGCGLGGLSWDDVKPLFNEYLTPLHGAVIVYGPLE